MNKYINLLKSELVFKQLSIIQLLVYFGAWFSNVAIYTLLLELEVQPQIIAFVASLHFLAGVFQAPFSGSIIDSVNSKKLMLLLIALQVVSTFLLIFVNDLSDLNLLYLLIFIKMSAASFYFTTEMSLLPKIISSDKLQNANELHSIIWSLSYTFGMAMSGFLVFFFGIKFAFLLDVFMFIVSFILLYKVKIDIKKTNKKEKLLKMMVDTFSYIKNTPKTFHLILIHSFVGLSAFDVLIALMVDKYYASILATSLALGLLNASRAVGLVFGSVLMNRWLNNKFLIYVFIFQALSIWIWAYVMHNFYLSLVASIIVGLFTTTLWSYTYTLLHKNIDEKYYGRVIAYNDMLFLSSSAFTSFTIGFLAQKSFSLEFIAVLIGLGFIVGAIYYSWILNTQITKK